MEDIKRQFLVFEVKGVPSLFTESNRIQKAAGKTLREHQTHPGQRVSCRAPGGRYGTEQAEILLIEREERTGQVPKTARKNIRYFSSLGTAVLALWECISGGMDWQDRFSNVCLGVVSSFKWSCFLELLQLLDMVYEGCCTERILPSR